MLVRSIRSLLSSYSTSAVGASDVGASGANIVNGQADATRVLRDFGALLEGVVDAADAVFLGCEQEAA